jgi:uncharacterized protein YciI
MAGEGKVFWVVFHPCRPDFHTTMTPEEQAHMVGHLRLLEEQQEAGKLKFAGRASDASHGIAVFEVESEDELGAILATNPACKAGVLRPEVKPYTLPRSSRPSEPRVEREAPAAREGEGGEGDR